LSIINKWSGAFFVSKNLRQARFFHSNDEWLQ
jgi:hypothetical protein